MQYKAKKIAYMFLVALLVSGLLFSPAIPAAASAPGAVESAYTLLEVQGGRILKPFTLSGVFDGIMINGYRLNDPYAAYLWDNEDGAFEPLESPDDFIAGNFIQLRNITGGSGIDGVLIVAWEDSEDYWDSGMYWNADFDDEGAFSDGQEWRIPFGQRLLNEYGIGGALEDYSNVVDYADLENSTYWPLHDYYNATSSETLVMLTGFRTTLQATGWACGPTSATMVLDWFGLRGDLNEEDLASLRQKSTQGGSTNLQQMINIFEGLNALYDADKGEWGRWDILSSYDIAEQYGITKPAGGKYSLTRADDLMDGTLIKQLLSDGIPVLIGWNSFGGHWQVIIGFDDMGTDATKDDVLILADPYDTTDHRNDGYNIQSLERFVYDWSAGFDPDFRHGIFVAAVPEGWEYDQAIGEGIVDYKEGYDGDASDAMKMSYGRTAADLEKYYATTAWRGDNGLAGAATGGYERVPNDGVNVSPYYAHYDYYNLESGESSISGGELILLENFRTQQQATEWTCGLTSALMAIEWLGGNPGFAGLLNAYSDEELAAVADAYGFDVWGLLDDRLTELNLAQMRGADRTRAGATTLNDMINIFDTLNGDADYLNAIAAANGWDTLKEWAYITTDNLTRGAYTDGTGRVHYLTDGPADDGLIPYCLSVGAPVLIGWNEWGGHWQVIIGYDDMDTDDTQDDVLILADPYDTTDHNQDGYYLEAFERLVYGWNADFDTRGSDVFLIPYLVDTDIPAAAYMKTPDETLGDIMDELGSDISVPDIGALTDADAAIEALKAYLTDKGYEAGLDYAIADAAVLDGAPTDFDAAMYGKVTLTVRLRCGTSMGTMQVAVYGITDIPAYAASPGNGQANFDFGIKSANGKGYTLYLSKTGLRGSFAPYANVNYNAKGAHIKGLTNGVRYYAYVEYKDASGKITRSRVVEFIPSK